MSPLRSLSLTLASALLAGALAAPAAAQSSPYAADALRFSERAPGVTPRAMGLGGALVSGVADPGALFANPAGLGLYRSSEAHGALGTASTTDDARYLVGGDETASEASYRTTRLGNLAYVARVPTLRGALVFALGYHQTNVFDRSLEFGGRTNASSISASLLPADYEVDADGNLTIFDDAAFIAYNAGLVEFLPENLPGKTYPFYEAVKAGTTIEQAGSVRESGSMNEVSAGAAVEAAPGVLVGGALNFSFGRYRFDRSFTETDVLGQNGPDDYVVILEDRTLRGFESVEVTDRISDDLFGLSGRLGLSYAPARSPVRLGLTLETPTYTTVNEDYSTVVETRFDEGSLPAYGGESGDVGFGTFEYTITTPWRIAAGASFGAAGLRLFADAEAVDWSQMRLDAGSDDAFFDEANDEIRRTLDAVVNTRLGAEYTLGALTVRGGYAFQPDPRESTGLDRTFLSAGLSYALTPRTALDLGFVQTRFDDAYAPYVVADDLLGRAAQPLVEEDVTRNRFTLGVRVGF